MTKFKKILNETATLNLIFAGLVLVFLIIRFWKFINTEYIVLWWDSAAYALVSIQPISSENFWFGRQPPLYPLFFKVFAYPAEIQEQLIPWFSELFSFKPGIMLGLGDAPVYQLVRESYDLISMAILQFLIVSSSWVLFAISVGKSYKRPLIQLAAIFIILALGCESMVTLWDRHIMTEALSLSLFVLVLSFFLHYDSILKSPATFVLLVLLMCFYSFIRMTNNYFLPFLAVFVVLMVLTNKPRRFALPSLIVCIMVALIAFNQYGIFKGERGKYPMKSLVSSRVSSEGFEDVYEYFRKQGMPEIPESFRGQLWKAPYEEYPEIDAWMKQDAASTYQWFLLRHPVYFLTRPFKNTNELNKPVYAVLTPKVTPYEISEQSTYAIFFTDWFLWVAFFACAGLVFLQRTRLVEKRKELLMSLTIVLGSCATLIVIWHGDLVEIDRHSVQFALGLRIGLILAILSLTDLLFGIDIEA